MGFWPVNLCYDGCAGWGHVHTLMEGVIVENKSSVEPVWKWAFDILD